MPESPDDGRSSTARGAVWATRLSSLGMEIAVPALGGYWLDRQWGTSPWLLVVGAVLGIILFSVSVLRLSQDLGKHSSVGQRESRSSKS